MGSAYVKYLYLPSTVYNIQNTIIHIQYMHKFQKY